MLFKPNRQYFVWALVLKVLDVEKAYQFYPDNGVETDPVLQLELHHSANEA
jgi:hypothetical protein